MTADQIIAQYIYSAVRLGAKFGQEPYPAYVDQTVHAIRADLSEHGYEIVVLWVLDQEEP